MNSPSYIVSPLFATVTFEDGYCATVTNEDSRFNEVIYAIKNKLWNDLRNILEPLENIKSYVNSYADKDISIYNGVVTYKGTELHSTLTERLASMLEDGYDIGPLAKFLANLMDNPSYRAVNETFDFLEASQLPITEDGCFLAYKRVRDDFKDIFSGKIDNSPGATPSMPRNMVDEDKSRTCSNGLHFCAREYLPYYGTSGGGKVIMVKINPRDVVAIPEDYHNAKGRCCYYEVVREMPLLTEEYSALPEENLERAYYDEYDVDRQSETIIAREVDTGREYEYDSVEQASEDLSVPASYIRRVLRGDRASTGGFTFRYEDDLTFRDRFNQIAEDYHDMKNPEASFDEYLNEFWGSDEYNDKDYWNK